MIYFGIYDERRVLNLTLKGNNPILIRIFEPNSTTHHKITNESNYKDILELSIFDYVTSPKKDELDETFKQINEFILNNTFDEVIIHCSLGLSRSPAIMLCIAKILNNSNLEEEIKEKFKHYNKFIIEAFKKYPYIIKKGFSTEIFECVNEFTHQNLAFESEKIIINHNILKDDYVEPKKKTKKIY